jgi:hypothetical protein
MDHLLLHQVDIAELVESLSDNCSTLSQSLSSLSGAGTNLLTLFE